jgi:hypothetical protein
LESESGSGGTVPNGLTVRREGVRSDEAGASSDLPVEVDETAVPDGLRQARAIIRLGSRAGVWGLVGGFGMMTAFTIGAPITLGLAISSMGVGLIVSGVGTTAASWSALRVARPRNILVRVASVLGLPLGGVLTILGATSLFRWAPLVNLVNWITPVAGTLGGLVLVILVIRFLMGIGDDRERGE